MSNDITSMVEGHPVTPTRLWRVLLPLAWLFVGFAALGFASSVAKSTSLGWGFLAIAGLMIAALALWGGMKPLGNWLKAEWAVCRKQAACPHLDADWATHDACPDCGYSPVFEVAC